VGDCSVHILSKFSTLFNPCVLGLKGDGISMQLVPVDAAEEGMTHDCLAPLWAVAQPLLNIPYKQALEQVLGIAAQKRCSTVQS